MIKFLVFLERGKNRIRFPSIYSTVQNTMGKPVPRSSIPLDVLQVGDVLAFEVLHDYREPNEWFELVIE